ncbi:DNA mismatch repair protein MutS [Clostridium intestinale]|uniref:DNA mismatch repair protein MutS n=1 Tax=Clostridium intestinale DSM 6191 TaxID=1121320 RepID=A0A1M5TW26_9CLOT|nr:DNA mismatch repair protein MutS [Clostridium intestinale]SHH54987.1 DNA mismatch repair protein MutS [Clostridium intestinale DSM 6191]
MALTPMMQQYFEIKEKYKDCILFFRLGDFYEMFFEDAEVASKELELVLTGRDCGLENRAPMCGIPYHAANSYIGRLISKGYKVAIGEQVEDPALAKGIVKRDVIKVITPGTFTDTAFIDDSKNNFIMSIYKSKENLCAISSTDISTGDFYCTSFTYDISLIGDEISKYKPSEVILNDDFRDHTAQFALIYNGLISFRDNMYFENDYSYLYDQFKDIEFNLVQDEKKSSINSLIKYIIDTQKMSLSNINTINFYNIEDFMTIDASSRRNLELTENIKDKNKKDSLLWVLDKTKTSMGSRTLRRWIDEPLISLEKINSRLDAVDELRNTLIDLEELREALKAIYDIERIIGKVSNKNVSAKDLISLKLSLFKVPTIKNIISKFNSSLFSTYYNDLDELADIRDLLENSILDDPSLSIKEGNIIKDSYNETIDKLREAKFKGKEWIAALENQEREFTGIKSLKVGYNKVFGYYIEISKANYSNIPEGRYIRKQTLANAERFITDELKKIEDDILGAEEKLIALEYNVFCEIRDEVEAAVDRLKLTAKIISELDVISTFSKLAMENNYVRPKLNNLGKTTITEGRHPVVEKVIDRGEFVSNDTKLDIKDNQLLIITGPNMAGKSTYMRQVALITLMAQIGCFIPATSGDIGICDKIFTRIGASDDLAGGKSTFMVEMWEVSNILKNATSNSLVLLDEVGRGTSTYDGLSIAWSVIEYLSKGKLKPRTLFATHYHELTQLEAEISGVKNFSVSVKEINDTIIFLRKIVPGGADQSYGIEVAKLAGLPTEVIERAKDILEGLEKNQTSKSKIETKEKPKAKTKNNVDTSMQMDFGSLAKDGMLNKLATLDILNMTPMDAMNNLHNIIKEAKELLK